MTDNGVTFKYQNHLCINMADKIQMPSSQGGLTRYFDEYKSSISLKPEHVIIFAILIMAIEIFLHYKGLSILGISP